MTKRISKKIDRFSVLVIALLVTFTIIPAASYGEQKDHKEMTLIMAGHAQPGVPYAYEAGRIFPTLVNKNGKGIVQVDDFWGGTLLKSKYALAGLRAGTADIIHLPAAYLLGSLPILGIQSLPVWDSITDSYEDLKMGSPLYNLQNEVLKKHNIYQLASSGQIPNFLFTTKKLVRTPEDMKGLKLRVAGKVSAKAVQALGAVPVTMPSVEIAQSLQRGIIDGVVINAWSFPAYGVVDLCKYMLKMPFSGITSPVFVLREKWDSWPEDVRKVLTDASEEWEATYIAPEGAMRDEHLKGELSAYYKKRGVTAILPTQEAKAAFRKKVTPVLDWWVEQVGEDVGRKALKFTDDKQ